MTGAEVKKLLLDNGYTLASVAKDMDITPQALQSRLNAKSLRVEVVEEIEAAIKKSLSSLKAGKIAFGAEPEPENKKTGKDIRSEKAFGSTQQKGLLFVPITAQAGYTLHYDESLYLEQLERVFIPGMPYDGERYRIFEIEGDSMTPTLEPGFFVIAERVEPADWGSTAQYYVYVIIKESQILIKRLYRQNNGDFVMISDNEEYYPQQELKKMDIKELWLVKRKMDWHMPPPKKFEITIKPKQ